MILNEDAKRYLEQYSRFNIPVISDLYAMDFDGVNRRWVYFTYDQDYGYKANVWMIEKIITSTPISFTGGSIEEFPSPADTELYKSLYDL